MEDRLLASNFEGSGLADILNLLDCWCIKAINLLFSSTSQPRSPRADRHDMEIERFGSISVAVFSKHSCFSSVAKYFIITKLEVFFLESHLFCQKASKLMGYKVNFHLMPH